MQETYKVGNAQSIGAYQMQSSYFATDCGPRCLAALAEGEIDHINGRRGAVLAVEACMRELRHMPKEVGFSEFSDTIAAKILRDLREIIYLGKIPCLSLSFQIAENGNLCYYSVGSNQAFLYDGNGYRLLRGTCGKVDFRKGMTAGMISRGVWEALNEKEMVSYLKKKAHPYEKAQQMMMGVIEKNKKMARNAAIVLVEGCI